jgi:hypothetical protein
MRLLRGLGATLLWVVASLLGLVAVLLCATILLLPLGIPLLGLARRLYGMATRLLLPRAVSHPLEETKKQARTHGKRARRQGKSARKNGRKVKDAIAGTLPERSVDRGRKLFGRKPKRGRKRIFG